jgi:hypothetical protein
MKKYVAVSSVLLLTCAATSANAQQRSVPRGPAQMFVRADTNKDGKVTRAEFDVQSRSQFAEFDANKDGQISSADRPKGAPPPSQGPGGAEGRPGERLVQSFDANRDGKITRCEYNAGRNQFFQRADINKDGTVNKAEIQLVRPPAPPG